MKKISIFFWSFCFFISVHAQDTISLKNGVIINASILEKSRTSIKYKLSNQPSGDTISCTKLSKVRSIHYKNGEVNLLSSQNPRSIFPLGVSLGIMPSPHDPRFNCNLNYFITPKISSEFVVNMGIGNGNDLFTYYEIGFKYWLASKYSKSGFSPYLGYLIGKIDFMYFWDIPLGISYISKSGFQTGLQCGLGSAFDRDYANIAPYVTLSLGWRFKVKKH
ncbi:MAG: hypothetical protein ACOYM7_10360 [Paludibacter sp.]